MPGWSPGTGWDQQEGEFPRVELQWVWPPLPRLALQTGKGLRCHILQGAWFIGHQGEGWQWFLSVRKFQGKWGRKVMPGKATRPSCQLLFFQQPETAPWDPSWRWQRSQTEQDVWTSVSGPSSLLLLLCWEGERVILHGSAYEKVLGSGHENYRVTFL